jgi:nucleotide-binding universal stress UspA family protein
MCCVDRSEATPRVLAEARRLRSGDAGRLTLVHVAPPVNVLRGGLTEWEIDEGDPLGPPRRWLDDLAGQVDGSEAVLLSGDPPAAVACDWARSEGADLMIAAAYRSGIARVLLGSFARSLIDLAPCDAIVVRPAAEERPATPAEAGLHIACCVDDPHEGGVAVAATARLADAREARVSVVHAVAPPGGLPRRLIARLLPMPSARRRAALERLRRHAAGLPGAERVLLVGPPGPIVCEWAARSLVELLVVGPRTGGRAGLGGFASHLVGAAPCPVMLARRPNGAEAG